MGGYSSEEQTERARKRVLFFYCNLSDLSMLLFSLLSTNDGIGEARQWRAQFILILLSHCTMQEREPGITGFTLLL